MQLPVSPKLDWRVAEVLCAVRWAQNMLVEVLSNHGGDGIAPEAADKIREATTALADVRFLQHKYEAEQAVKLK